MEVLREKLKQLIQSRKYHKLWMSMISVMAGIVVFVTTYALILPAITLERKAAEKMAGFDASAEGTDILPESSVLMDGDLMPADGFLTDDILGDQAFSIQEEMEEEGFEDGTVYDGETVLEDGFLIEEEPYTEEELLLVEDRFAADEGNLVNEVLPEDGLLSGGILSGAWDLPEDGILRREEDLPEEETLREEELLPEEETLREEELLPEEETLREEELLPEVEILRGEELLLKEASLQKEETFVEEELLPKDSQVSKDPEDSEPADTYIILPGKEIDQTEEELPEEETITEAATGSMQESNTEATTGSMQETITEAAIGNETEAVAEAWALLTYEGKDYQIFVSYGEDAQLPEGAQLAVHEIREKTGNYKTYLEQSAEALGEEPRSVSYARFFDISIVKDGVELQPAEGATVDVQIRLADVEEQENDPQIIHFGEEAEVLEAKPEEEFTAPESFVEDMGVAQQEIEFAEETAAVENVICFETTGFSVFGVIYTVDFSYSVNGQMYDFSLPGGEKIALSELIEVLGILQKTKFEDVEEFISHISDVEFSDESLVKVTHKTPALGVLGDEDWVLESVGPFDTVEYLAITMDNGDVVTIRVTDDQVTTTSDLKTIASIKSIDGAVDNGDGTYTVVAGETYNINLHFEETDTIQANMDGSVTYQLPAGFNFTGSKSGTIELEVSAGNYAEATYTISDSGLITFTWVTSNSNYEALKASGYMTFDFDLTGKFDGSTTELSFTDTTTGTVKVETGGHLDISKSGSYNAETNMVEYTVTVTGTGVNNNVNVQDTISGDALTFNSITEITSSKNGTVTPSSQSTNSEGFNMTFANVGNGETITIKYTADVNLSMLAGATDEQKLTFTKNTVQTTSDHQTDPKTADHNLQYNIGISDVNKQAVEKGEVGSDGKQTISWEINANRNSNISMNGQSITDTIKADSRDRLHYSGAGIYVTKRDKSGNVVGTERQLVTWAELGVTDLSSAFTWTYSPTDTTPYWYQIDYETVADSSGLISNKNLGNDVDGGYGTHSGGQSSVGPLGGGIGLKKQAVKTDLANKEVTWEITVNVPKEGLDSCVVRDTLPAYIIDNSTTPNGFAGKDSLVSVNVTSGLIEGESFTQTTGSFEDGREYVELTFHKTNADGTTSDGLSSSSATRKVRIQVVTKLDDDYLKYAEEHPDDYNARTHTNNVDMWANSEVLSDQASVQIDESNPSISKSHADIEKSDAGESTVMVKYYVTLTGVNDNTNFPIVLTDTFNSKYFSFQDLKTPDWNETNGYVYGTDINTPKGGTKGSNRVVAEMIPGTLTITLNQDDLPKNGSDYYSLYVVQYYLKVKDAATLLRLNNDAVQQPNGTITLVNRVTSDDFGTATDTVDYQVPMLSKDLLKDTQIALDPTTGMYKGTFKIDVNPDAKTIGDEATLTLTDTTSNLSIVYDTIRVYEADGTTVCSNAEWNRSGYSVVYTLPNSRHLKIRYDVIVTGSGEVNWENTAELNGQKVTKTGTQDMSAAGNGSGYTYKIDILKHDKDDLTKTLPGAKFTLYRWTGSQEYTGQDMLTYSDLTKYDYLWQQIRTDLVTESNGIARLDHETNGEGGHLRRDTWYMLVETEAPDGYDKASYNPIFKIAKDGQADYSNYTYVNGDTLAIRNTQTPPTKADITATKVWTGDDDDTSLRKPVTLHLYADGVPYAEYKDSDNNSLAGRSDTDVTLSDENSWTYEWKNLPGGPTYTVKEDAVPGYVTSYSPTYGLVKDGTITVTNAKRQNKTAIHVEKEWNGTPTADVTLQLKRNVSRNSVVEIYGNDNGGTGFVSAQYFPAGSTVRLIYKSRYINENDIYDPGFTITNRATNEEIYSQAERHNTDGLTDNNISYPFTVPEGGVKITFTKVDKDNIKDGSWAFNEAPIVELVSFDTASGESEEDAVYTLENHTVTLNADNNWQADVDNLLLSDEDGSYTYYVEEIGMNDGTTTPEEAGYTVTYDNNEGITKGTIRVTNSKEDPNKTTITLNKNWSGNNHGGNTEVRYEIYRTTVEPKYHTVTLKYPEEVNNDTGHKDISQTRTKTYQVLDGSNVELFVTHAWWDPYPSELYDVKVNGAVQHFDAQHASSREITLYSWVKYEEHIFTIDNITADTTIELDYKNLNAEEFMEPVLEERPQISLGTPYKTGTISGGGNNWTTTITGLDKTDEAGKPYYYFIYETDLDMDDTTDLTRFDTSYSHQYVDATSNDREVTITNTIRPEYTWLQVHKVWENVEELPGSVDVVLYRRLKTEAGKPHWYDQIKIVPNGLKEAVDATKWNQDLHETWSAGWYALSPDYDYFIAETNVNGEWYSNASYFINYADASGRAITPETYEGDNNRYYPVQTGAVSGYHHATITNANTQVNFEKKWAGATEGKFIIDGEEYEAKDFIIEVQLKQYINGSATAANPMKASDQYNASQIMTLDGVADENQTGKYYENSPWHFVWKELPAIGMDASGSREDYTYKVEETGIYLKGADGKKTGDNLLETGIFTQKTSADGRTITNTIKKVDIPTTDVTVNKSWLNKDASTDWPTGVEVEMTLYRVEKNANEEEIFVKVAGASITNPVTLTAEEGEQSYTWTDLPKTLSDGTTEIKYVVKETAVTGYTSYATTAEGSEKSDTAEALLSASSGAEEEDAETMLTASFLNRENEGGKVNIQITKNITDASGNPIELVADVANKFAVLTSTTDTDPNHVIDVNKNEYKGEYPNIGSYTNKVADTEITVSYEGNTEDSSKSATTGSVYVDDLEGGMYTITEDPKSIPDKIYDKDGNVYQYKETKLESEYAWRENGDEGARHWSKTYTKADDKLIAIPEAAGAYGDGLYNGYLDFYVTNVYEKVDEIVTTEILNLELDKAWDRGGDATPPASGSVTFELHQVETTVTTTASGGSEGEGSNTDNNSTSEEATVKIINPYNSSEVLRTIDSYSDGSKIHVGDNVILIIGGYKWIGNENSAYHSGVSNVSIVSPKATFTVTSSDAHVSFGIDYKGEPWSATITKDTGIYKATFSDLNKVIAFEKGNTLSITFTVTSDSGTNLTYDKGYGWSNNSSYIGSYGKGTHTVAVGNGAAEDYSISFSNASGVDLTSVSISGGTDGGTGTGSNTSTSKKEDPDGSGFPKTITLTADDVSGNLWKHVEEGLLSKVTSTSGDTTSTKTYTYYVVETGRTGLASAYSEPSISGKGSQSNPINGADGSDHKVTINAKNTVPNPNDKFIIVKKTWWDEDGNELLNHPDEVLVDVYRIKLPVVTGGSGGVSYNALTPDEVFGTGFTEAELKDDQGQWKHLTFLTDKVFFDGTNYYYIRKGQSNFAGDQVVDKGYWDLSGHLQSGQIVTRLTGTVWHSPEDFTNEMGVQSGRDDIRRGDVMIYDGNYYVYIVSNGYDATNHSNGNEFGDNTNWVKIDAANVLVDLTLNLMPNEEYLTEGDILETYIPQMVTYIQNQLQEKGINWVPDVDKAGEGDFALYKENVRVSNDDNWQTSFTAEQGYLYFFFEKPIPGFVTKYENQEHGVFDQTQAVGITNTTTVGQLDVTKDWTGDEITGDQVFVKIFRDGVDITDDIAADAASYGLSAGEDRFFLRNGHKFLIIKKTGNTWETVQIKDLPIAEYSVNAKAYEYSVQEVGYHDTAEGHTGYYWSASDVLTGYSTMVYTRSESTDTDGKKTVSYTEGTATVSTGAASEGVTVGSVNVVPAAEEGKDPTITFTSGKSLVTVQNASEATLDLTVQKRWQSNHTTWNPDYGQNLSIYFKLYKVKGEAREQVNHIIYQLTKDTKVDVAESDLGSDAALVKAKFPQNTDSTYSIPFMITIPDLPVLKDGWEYAVVECSASGTEFEQGENKTFWTCLEFNNTTTAIKNDLTDVSATKSWDDQSITGASHPAVTFSLYRTTDTIPDNGWSNETGYDHLEDINWGSPVATAAITAGATGDALIAKWTDLPKYDITTGKLYTYYVQESAVDGYTLKSRGLAGGNKYQFTFENKLDDKTTFEFSKIWKDISSNPTTWPGDATITVTLNAYTSDKPNSKAITDVVVTLSKIGTSDVTLAWTATTSDDGKKTTFKVGGLAKYSSDGKELTYYVVESQVDGYKAPSYGFVSDDGVLRIPQDHGNKAENGEVVVNTPEGGYELPSTGGPGTRLFTIVGSILITGAGILLVRRRRRTI